LLVFGFLERNCTNLLNQFCHQGAPEELFAVLQLAAGGLPSYVAILLFSLALRFSRFTASRSSQLT
jgi:hypothetical protein